MAFMLVAVTVGRLGTAGDGPAGRGLVTLAQVVMAVQLCVSHHGRMPMRRVHCHGRHLAQVLRLNDRMVHVVSLSRVLLHGHGVAGQATQGQQQNQEQGQKASHGVNDSDGRG